MPQFTRLTTGRDRDLVVFLIGMRINHRHQSRRGPLRHHRLPRVGTGATAHLGATTCLSPADTPGSVRPFG